MKRYLFTLAFGCSVNTTPPEVAAQKFVDDLGIKIIGRPNCTQVDTDEDGYVTCTIRTDSAVQSLQCAGITNYGCGGTGSTKYAVGCKQTSWAKAPGQVLSP